MQSDSEKGMCWRQGNWATETKLEWAKYSIHRYIAHVKLKVYINIRSIRVWNMSGWFYKWCGPWRWILSSSLYCIEQEKVTVIKSYFSLALAAFASINCILITQLKLNSISWRLYRLFSLFIVSLSRSLSVCVYRSSYCCRHHTDGWIILSILCALLI